MVGKIKLFGRYLFDVIAFGFVNKGGITEMKLWETVGCCCLNCRLTPLSCRVMVQSNKVQDDELI